MDDVPLVVLAGLLGLVAVSQVGLWAVLLQIIQQQGRILLRLDALADASRVADDHIRSDNLLPMVAAAAPAAAPQSLPVGSVIGDFQVPDLSGRLVGPAEWRGQRTLLIHWSTTCGFCELIAPDLARLGPDLERRRVRLVLASYGQAEANRRLAEEYALACSILLQPQDEPLDAFRQLGTPVAYLLDEDGRVAEPLVVGADQVLELARRVASQPAAGRKHLIGERPLSQSRIERSGLKPGSPAPAFGLPEVHGGTVRLDDYRGRRVLLVFTDPHCGPCEALAPRLAQLSRGLADAGVQVVAIGRGDAQENLAKAEQYEFTFPLALQKRWEVSRAYGIFATPVGFLIDEQGTIAREVAIGPDAIVALAHEARAVGSEKE